VRFRRYVINTLIYVEFWTFKTLIGAKYEPFEQLENIKNVQFLPGVEKFCTFNREEGSLCAGATSGGFGNVGDRFHAGWDVL
jgi:hypothetical protein